MYYPNCQDQLHDVLTATGGQVPSDPFDYSSGHIDIYSELPDYGGSVIDSGDIDELTYIKDGGASLTGAFAANQTAKEKQKILEEESYGTPQWIQARTDQLKAVANGSAAVSARIGWWKGFCNGLKTALQGEGMTEDEVIDIVCKVLNNPQEYCGVDLGGGWPPTAQDLKDYGQGSDKIRGAVETLLNTFAKDKQQQDNE